MRILTDSIGAYRSAKTQLHRYDPRLKIALLCVCITGSFIAHAPFGIFGMSVLLTGILVMSNEPSSRRVTTGLARFSDLYLGVIVTIQSTF